MHGRAALGIAPRRVPVTIGTLRRRATYRAPSGRLCRLAPPDVEGAADGRAFRFEYLDESGGFYLTLANIGLLSQLGMP